MRKLLPDSWGFLCPVHTPDGSPCGLLNHLTRACTVVQSSADRKELLAALSPHLLAAGAVLLPVAASLPIATYLPILLDAQLVGRVHVDQGDAVADALRRLKVASGKGSLLERTLQTLEIALVRPQRGGMLSLIHI